jgi:diacylglycerol kinase (ATP)
VSEQKLKPSNWVESVNCAIDGLLWATSTQRHMRSHCLAAVAVLLTAVLLRVSALEFILVLFAVTLVLFAELINTAMEVLVDLVSPEYHPLAKRAKDVAAWAVLAASLGAAIMGFFVLVRHVVPPLGTSLDQLGQPPGELSVVSALVVTILVVLLKARFGRGTPLHGGMPSGHAAVTFSIATSLVLAGIGTVLSVLAVLMAAMVSQSRLLMGIHSLREVLIGAVLGVGVTLTIHFLLG